MRERNKESCQRKGGDQIIKDLGGGYSFTLSYLNNRAVLKSDLYFKSITIPTERYEPGACMESKKMT